MRAVKGEEIILIAEDKVGKLSEICEAIKNSGINIRAIGAYASDGKAFFRLITSDNVKAKKVLSSEGEVSKKEVIIVEMTDEVGQLSKLTGALKNAGINLTHIYGSTIKAGAPATVIFSSGDNAAALKVAYSI